VLSLTTSFGVGEWQPGDGIDTLLKRADMALYEAKLGGRDRVMKASEGFASPSYVSSGRPIRGRARSA
jgi:predicted signal transduction protein with EAL and GGDEF domain